MATSPEVVRRGLVMVGAAAIRDLRTVAQEVDAARLRPVLFEVSPSIVSEYGAAAALLASDWYADLRDEVDVPSSYTPEPVATVTEADVRATVAFSTETLRTLTEDLEMQVATAMASLELDLQKLVAAGFRDTITTNVARDPDAVGWRRYAKSSACKFCVMLAARGAVYTESTARFAAHGGCSCTAGPSWDPDAPRADAMQYVASAPQRTPEQRAALRDYLNQNFPDAPG